MHSGGLRPMDPCTTRAEPPNLYTLLARELRLQTPGMASLLGYPLYIN